MPTTDILYCIEEKGKCNIKELSNNLQIPAEKLEKALTDLAKHDLIEYDRQTGEVKLSNWLAKIEELLEEAKPSVATIIIPKNQKIRIEEISIENYTDTDLEINMRLTGKRKEIAICKIA